MASCICAGVPLSASRMTANDVVTDFADRDFRFAIAFARPRLDALVIISAIGVPPASGVRPSA
ncbi:MAG: hypothetical protein ABIR00_04005 [Nitrosospira sp.]